MDGRADLDDCRQHVAQLCRHHLDVARRAEQFLATDKADFVAKGVALSSDISALAALRTGLRERCMASAAFRPEVVAAGLSRALRIMWQRWCDDQPPVAFEVTAQEAIAATDDTTASPKSGENK